MFRVVTRPGMSRSFGLELQSASRHREKAPLAAAWARFVRLGQRPSVSGAF